MRNGAANLAVCLVNTIPSFSFFVLYEDLLYHFGILLLLDTTQFISQELQELWNDVLLY